MLPTSMRCQHFGSVHCDLDGRVNYVGIKLNSRSFGMNLGPQVRPSRPPLRLAFNLLHRFPFVTARTQPRPGRIGLIDWTASTLGYT